MERCCHQVINQFAFLKERRSKISHSNLLTTVLLTAVLFGALFLKRLRLTGVIGVRALFSGCFSSNQELSCFIKRARRRISRSFTKRINSVCYLFVLLLLLRSGRLLTNAVEFDYAIVGACCFLWWLSFSLVIMANAVRIKYH